MIIWHWSHVRRDRILARAGEMVRSCWRLHARCASRRSLPTCHARDATCSATSSRAPRGSVGTRQVCAWRGYLAKTACGRGGGCDVVRIVIEREAARPKGHPEGKRSRRVW